MIVFLLLLFMPMPAHAFVGDIAGAIIDAMQPTSSSPDSDSDGGDDDD
jgi:hypothetical protein